MPGAVQDEADPCAYRCHRQCVCEVVPYEALGVRLEVTQTMAGIDGMKFKINEAC